MGQCQRTKGYSDLEDPIRRADRSSSDLVMKYAGCISIVLPFNITGWWKNRLISDRAKLRFAVGVAGPDEIRQISTVYIRV